MISAVRGVSHALFRPGRAPRGPAKGWKASPGRRKGLPEPLVEVASRLERITGSAGAGRGSLGRVGRKAGSATRPRCESGLPLTGPLAVGWPTEEGDSDCVARRGSDRRFSAKNPGVQHNLFVSFGHTRHPANRLRRPSFRVGAAGSQSPFSSATPHAREGRSIRDTFAGGAGREAVSVFLRLGPARGMPFMDTNWAG